MATPPIFELHNGDGTEGPFQFVFELLGTFSAVVVKVKNAADDQFVTQIEDTHYTLVRATKTITFLATFFPPVGVANIRIERFTTRDRQIDYVSGSTLSERNMDNDTNRLTMVDQEIESGITDALRRNDSRTAWDAEGLPSENALPAVNVTGWVTLGQLQALLSDVQIAELNEPTVLTFTGDGVTAQFLLSGAQGLTTGMPTVFMNGVIQRSDSGDYQIINKEDSSYPSFGDGNDVLDFDVAPPDGAIIHVRIFTGTVLGVLPDGFINDSDQIADNVVNEGHIRVATGNPGRIFVFDAVGEPSLPVASLDHLIATSQTLPSAALTALVAAGTGISMSLLNRNPAADVHMGGQLVTNVATPSASTDAANKAYVDGLLGSTKFKVGAVATEDLPLAASSTVSIQDIGFAPDIFVMQMMEAASPWASVGIWIRGGPATKRILIVGRSAAFAGPGLHTAYESIFAVTSVGSNMEIQNINQGHDGGDAIVGNSGMTDLLWFALKT